MQCNAHNNGMADYLCFTTLYNEMYMSVNNIELNLIEFSMEVESI